MEQFDSKYFRGQGPLYLADRDASGNPTGFVFIGDVSAAELQPQIDRTEKLENVSGSSAVAVSTLKSVKYSLNLTMDSVKAAHLALALSGTLTAIIAGSVTDQSHTANLDKFFKLQHTKVSSVVVTDSAGTTTYVDGTDYVLRADEGVIEVLSTGNITEGQALLVDYAYAAQSLVQSNPGNVEKYLMFSGINTADNDKRMRCEIYRCKLDPGALSMITEDVQGMQINGLIELDALRPAGDQLFSWLVED